jgi:hypothetical protein
MLHHTEWNQEGFELSSESDIVSFWITVQQYLAAHWVRSIGTPRTYRFLEPVRYSWSLYAISGRGRWSKEGGVGGRAKVVGRGG